MDNLYASLEQRYNLPEGSLTAVQNAEGSKDTDISPKGAIGRFQFMPETAQAYGVNPNDPVSSAHGAAKYLSDLMNQYGSFKAAVAHYNGGTKAGNAVANGQEAPYEETKKYLKNVSSNLPAIDASQVQMNEAIDPSQVLINEPINASEVQKEKTTLQKHFEKKSAGELALLGVGKSVEDTLQGGKQLLDIPAQFLEKQFPAVSKWGKTMGFPTAEESAKQTQETINKERAYGEALMEHPSAILGNVGGQLATAYLGGTALKGAGAVGAGEALINPSTYKAAAGTGAVLGALQPTIEGESKIFNTLSSSAVGVAGLGIVNALGRVAQPIANQLGEIGSNAVKTLKEAGIPLDAAQVTGSKLLERVKGALSDNPITAGAQVEFNSAQKQAYNKAVAKTMGEDATNVTPDVINNARTRLSDTYNQLFDRNGVRITRNFQNDLNGIKEEAIRILPANEHAIGNIVDDVIAKSKENMGHLDGRQYQSIKRQLDALEKQGGLSSHYAGELKDKLLDGLSDTVNRFGKENDISLLKDTNKQWGNMRKIEDIALKDPEGNVSPSLLYNSLATKGKRSVFYAEDPQLAKLAAAGKIILPEKLPNSGTTARLLAQAIPAAVGGAAYGAYKGDWSGAAEGAAAGYLAPKLAQKAMNNPNFVKYLSQGIQSTPIRSMLQAPKELGTQKIPVALWNNYLQSLPPEKK